MKNLLISVVLITALSFVFLACGGDDDPEPLSVYLTGGWDDEALVANIPVGHDEATFVWTLNGLPVSLETSNTIANPELGLYKVVVTSGDAVEQDTMLVGPGKLKGLWYRNQVTNDQIGGTQVTTNETLTVSPNGYLVVEASLAGVATGDRYRFAISNWEGPSSTYNISITTGSGFSTFISTNFPATNTYKVTGKFDIREGYDSDAVGGTSTAETYFYIRLKSDGKQFFRSLPAVSYTGTGGLPAIERVFENEEKANTRNN
jgi:hypothetical protein